jgi:hypothetical protein
VKIALLLKPHSYSFHIIAILRILLKYEIHIPEIQNLKLIYIIMYQNQRLYSFHPLDLLFLESRKGWREKKGLSCGSLSSDWLVPWNEAKKILPIF